MSFLLFLFRAVFVVAWIVSSLLSVAVVYPFVPLPARNFMNHQWSRALIWICGVEVRVVGQPVMQGPALWVANHVSWIDIFVLSSVRCVAFIAKSEIRRWPIIGWLVAKAGTVFIQRGQRHAIKTVGDQMKCRFAQGEVLGLFPEGTTSGGLDVGPFHSSLFDPAVRAEVCIQPVALRFLHRGKRSDYVAFVGDQNLVQNLWVLLGTTQVVVEVVFLPLFSIDQCQEWGRSKVAAHAHHVISHAVRSGRRG
ncbi:MAG TPA: 1-acyl-sn-glycerol-3-phosphate acyltransferase [Eoetvoesiella sp.]